MIPLDFISSHNGNRYDLRLDRLSDLQTNKFAGLDTMCEGILDASPFNHDAKESIFE